MEDGENLRREVASLEQAARDAAEETDKAERALEDLEGRRNAAAGRVAIARQARDNYVSRLEERREALARLLEAEAEANLRQAIAARDDAANRAAEAIAQLVVAFEQLDAARAATHERLAETKSRLRGRAEVEPEPATLEQEWARLIDFITTRSQLRLDEEVVEAAVSSPGGHDIDKLPAHLQLVARRRRTERMRATARSAWNNATRD
jgi:chromosome segregation ATPase